MRGLGSNMRRKDREVTELRRINEIIEACDCCRLSLRDGEGAYIVPLNFGYECEGGRGRFYFHCAGEGRKIDLLKACPYAAFELDGNHALVHGEKGCGFSFRYASVMGRGTVETVLDRTEKKKALTLITAHYGVERDWRFSDAEAAGVTVLRLDVAQMTCKEHR